MENKSHLSNLIARLDRIKAAADGAETSMPDDPSGDGTTDPKTGPQFTQYSKDKAQIETVPPDADEQPSSSMSEDHEQDNSFSSYTLSTAGSEAQSAKGEYTDRPTDPGTSMPAEAGQEKYSALNCTLEQNIDIFSKCAHALLTGAMQYDARVKQAAAAVQQYSQYPLGYFTKMAEDMGASPEEANEIAAIEAIVEEQPELLDELASMSPEELDELQAIAEAIDSEAAEQAVAEDAEAAALEKESFYRQEPVIQKTLASLNNGQLKQAAANIDILMQKAAEDDLSEEEIAAILEDAASEDSEDSEDVGLEDIPVEDGEEKEGCGGRCRRKKASSQDLYYMALQKQAEEDQAAFESLSPEEQALLASASDEELQDAIAEGDAVSEDPASIEDLLAEGSDDASEDVSAEDAEPTSEEAMSELAAAMDEQGITPEVLEEASKEASADPELYKIAQAVTQYRRSGKYVYHPATTEKAAKMRSISHRYLSEIFPHK